jgi:hypothetical protein
VSVVLTYLIRRLVNADQIRVKFFPSSSDLLKDHFVRLSYGELQVCTWLQRHSGTVRTVCRLVLGIKPFQAN